MKKAFTLVELLVVIAIISLLMALSLPVMRRVRDQGRDTVCRSHLRQMAIIMKSYTGDNDSLFPTSNLYHAPDSFNLEKWPSYLACCRWHDARTAQDGPWLAEHPELRGVLSVYLGNKQVILCQVGKRAKQLRGCWNTCTFCTHSTQIPIEPQFSYVMNAYLGRGINTSGMGTLTPDPRSFRWKEVRRMTQVTRTPADVFLFGEQNSWAINKEGKQPRSMDVHWPAPYNLSGKYYQSNEPPGPCMGTLNGTKL